MAVASLKASPSDDDARRRIVELALSLEGAPYVYGAESPQGFDCSGFVRYVYSSAAYIDLPRSSRAQYAQGARVALAAAKPGDVLVYGSASGSPDHVAIFLGKGSMIHAASEGPRRGIILSSLDDPSFSARFLGARSFLSTPPAEGAQASRRKAEPAACEIGFTVSSKAVSISDPIPAALGSSLAFTITNGTNADRVFVVAFCKAGDDSGKLAVLREDRVAIRADASRELTAFALASCGTYRLRLRIEGGPLLVERSWRVVDEGRQ